MSLELLLNEELRQEFLEYLKEDPEFENLNEEVLNEGKLLNKIRWKLALFSLRFLKESSINDFLRAYYSDKEGKETEKSKEWVAKSKKEKLKRMRELANEMKQEEKDKVANSEVAKKLEKSALISGVVSGVSGGLAVVAGLNVNAPTNKVNQLRVDASKNIQYGNNYAVAGNPTDPSVKHIDIEYLDGTTEYQRGAARYYNTAKVLNKTADKLLNFVPLLTSLIFGAMWGSIILAGVSAAKGLRQSHKANTVRRDEIMAELLKNKDKKDLKECLEFLNGDVDAQISLVEMYQCGDMKFYDVVENIKHQLTLKEELNMNLEKNNRY